MPVTRADEIDARPADTAKELLALAAQIAAPHAPFSFLTRDERKMTIDALRLSARQQASVESIGLLAFKGLVHPSQDWNGPQYKADKADCLEFARALLAKYDVFKKVEG